MKNVKKMRILIADDHGLVRRGIREVLHSRPGWRVAGEATNGREAVAMAIELKPDVAVVDVGMPELDGIEAVRQIRESVPEIKILVLTMNESDSIIGRALEAGVDGYLLKSDLTICLPEAVEAVVAGKRFLTPKVSEIVLEGFLESKSRHEKREGKGARITPRETEIIRLLAQGKSNKEIASLLQITVRTVETHRAKIMLKLGVHSLAELIHFAIRHGIITMTMQIF
jgi:two-component system, NarL family, response regulator NreC